MDFEYRDVLSARIPVCAGCTSNLRRALTVLAGVLLLPVVSGCQLGWDTLDLSTVRAARSDYQDYYESYPLREDEMGQPDDDRKPGIGSVIVGQLLSIFPGMFVHGLGHYYAGDYETATRIRHVGEVGYISLLIGGGLVTGGYFIGPSLSVANDDDIVQGYAYGLYGAGGLLGVVGVGYFFTAWFYDMIDTSRAVRSGGEPPPPSSLLESMDIFD